MATAAPNSGLPMLYDQLEPLNSGQHAKLKIRRMSGIPQLAQTHAIPLTIDEFGLAQRHYPIIFSVGEDSVPLALMGLNEGVNTFIGDDGRMFDAATYVPAYLRRYPFLLARLNPESDDSRCASIRLPAPLPRMRTAKRCLMATSQAPPPRRCCSSANSSRLRVSARPCS
jgi:hypothetical protein